MVVTARRKPSPDNYLECLAEKSRAMLAHDHHERALSEAMGVPTARLHEAMDRARSGVMDVKLVMKIGAFMKAEQELDEALSLYEQALRLHADKAYKELDE